MSTAQLVREARRASGLTQRDLAARAGIPQSAVADIERSAHDTRGDALNHLVGAAGYQLFVLPTTAHSAADWADLIYQELRSQRRSEEVAFRALIGLNDDLTSVSPPLRVALCVAPPAFCGDPRFDAGIAAIADHHLSTARLPLPGWVREPSRVLAEPWLVSPFTRLSDVPPAFRRHGVQLGASELASV
jgi:transcriptional regulator with XRE-family HTH domain